MTPNQTPLQSPTISRRVRSSQNCQTRSGQSRSDSSVGTTVTATKPPKRPRDPNQLAKAIVDIATGAEAATLEPIPSDARKKASAKGGSARAEKLSSVRRSEISANAAKVRWKSIK